MNKSLVFALSLLSTGHLFVSCNKDKDANRIPEYTVPATYNFENSDYTESSTRVSMWSGLTSYLGKSTTRQLSGDTAAYLWNNTNAAFTAETVVNTPYNHTALNAAPYNLAGQTADAALYKSYIDSMVKISQYFSANASAGVPGKIGIRLFNHSGLEFNQVVAKGLMGALVLQQVYNHLDKAATADNNTVTPGVGTAAQHHWDLAFGYLGIPRDYDTSKTYAGTDPARPLGLGGYFAERGKYLKAGGTIFEAFRKGRAALAAKDNIARDAAASVIKNVLEKLLAAAAYHYVTAPQTSTDLAAKFHGLSEGYGFLAALKYRPAISRLSATEYQKLQDILNTNFWDLAADAGNTKLKQAQAILTSAYGQLAAN